MPEWVTSLSLILAVALSAFNLWDKIDAKKKALKEPTKNLELRLSNLENLVNQKFINYDSHFDSDLKRLEELEKGNKATQKALLALISHALDGNDIESLKRARNELNEFLINK